MLLISRIILTIFILYALVLVWTKNVNLIIWAKKGIEKLIPINDTKEEVTLLYEWARENNHPVELSDVWSQGGSGAIELAKTLVEIIKEILSEFPALREKVLKWLQETEPSKNP